MGMQTRARAEFFQGKQTPRYSDRKLSLGSSKSEMPAKMGVWGR